MTTITAKMIAAGRNAGPTRITMTNKEIIAIYEAMEAARTAPAREPGFYWITQPSMPIARIAEWRDDGWYLTGSALAWPDNDVTVIERVRITLPVINDGWITHDGWALPLASSNCHIRRRDGAEGPIEYLNGRWFWTPDDLGSSPFDIIAYRP